ncbi:MAG: translocation/assembly module TamB domain-containing protein [bacterium]|nr:translocation/assembly module TamB domain-containing protein [bacterium]
MLLLLIIVILGSGIYLCWKIGLEKIKERTIVSLKEEVGATVMIEKVYGRFFRDVVFEGVRVSREDDRFFDIQRLELKFSLWDLIRKDPFIKKIILINPSFTLNRDKLVKWKWIDYLKKDIHFSKPIKIMVKNGEVNISDYPRGKDTSFRNIHGYIDLNRLNLSFNWKDIQINVKGRINFNNKRMNLELITNEFNAKDLKELFFVNKQPKSKVWVNLEDLSLTTKFRGIMNYSDFAVQGIIEFPLLAIRKKVEKVLPSLWANIRYSNRILEINHLRFGEGCTLQGKVDWTKRPALDLRMTCSEASTKPLFILAGIEDLGYHLAGSLWMKGPIDSLQYRGDLSLQNQRQTGKKIHIVFSGQGEDIELRGVREKEIFTSRGKVFYKSKRFSNIRDRESEIPFQFSGFLRDFCLAGFNISSNLFLQGRLVKDSSFINLTLRDFSLDKRKKIGRIITDISFKKKHLTLSSVFSNGYSILGDATFVTTKKVDIHRLLIRYKEKGEINTKGELNLANYQVRLKGDINELKVGNVPFTGKVLSEFELRDNPFFLKQLKIKSLEGTDLFLTGSIWKTLDLRFKVRNGRFSDLVKEWGGNFEFSGKIEGDLDNPKVSGTIFSNSLNIKDKRIDRLSGNISYSGKVVKLLSIRLGSGILLKGEIDCLTSKLLGKLYLNRVRNLFSCLPGTYETSGIIDLTGSLSSPRISGDLSFSRINIPGVSAEKGYLKFSFEDDKFETSKFYIIQKEGYFIINRCEVDFKHKTTKMDGNFKDFQITKISLSCNFRLSNNQFIVKDIVFLKKYRFKELRTYLNYSGKELKFTLDGKSGLIGTIRFQDNVVIDGLELWKEGVKVGEVSGNVNIKDKNCDLDVKLLDLKLSYSSSEEEILCFLDSYLHIFGPLNSPNLDGEIFVNGNLRLPFLADEIRDFSTHILVKDGFFKISSFRADIGKGNLRIDSPSDFTLERLNLTISTDYIKVNLKDFLEGLVKFKISVSGTYERPCFTGEILFRNTSFTYPYPEKGRYKFLHDCEFDVKLIAWKNIKYYNDYVKAYIKEKDSIILRGKGGDVTVLGKVSSKRGRFEYLGTEFKIIKASLRFQANERPYIDAQGKAKIGDTEILLTYSGSLSSKPVLSCLNNPEKTEEELVRLLRYGRDYGSLNEATLDELLRVGIARLVGRGLDSRLLNPIERRLGRFLKLDVDLKFPIVEGVIKESVGEEKKTEELTELDLGKYITDDLYLIYKGTLKERIGLRHELGFQYYLPNGETIKYRYKPDEKHKGHEITIEKEIQF